jgi:hypothetical protein
MSSPVDQAKNAEKFLDDNCLTQSRSSGISKMHTNTHTSN